MRCLHKFAVHVEQSQHCAIRIIGNIFARAIQVLGREAANQKLNVHEWNAREMYRISLSCSSLDKKSIFCGESFDSDNNKLHNWTKEGKLLQFDEDIFCDLNLPDPLRFRTSLSSHATLCACSRQIKLYNYCPNHFAIV